MRYAVLLVALLTSFPASAETIRLQCFLRTVWDNGEAKELADADVPILVSVQIEPDGTVVMTNSNFLGAEFKGTATEEVIRGLFRYGSYKGSSWTQMEVNRFTGTITWDVVEPGMRKVHEGRCKTANQRLF